MRVLPITGAQWAKLSNAVGQVGHLYYNKYLTNIIVICILSGMYGLKAHRRDNKEDCESDSKALEELHLRVLDTMAVGFSEQSLNTNTLYTKQLVPWVMPCQFLH